jgi:hypothetical protein
MGVSARIMMICAAGSAVIAAAGCGSSSPGNSGGMHGATTAPSAAELQSSMRQSVGQADSVHVNGHMSNNGLPITINLDVTRNGGVSGTVSQNGAPLHVIAVKNKVYFKATQAFLNELKAPSGVCSLVCGKWIQLPPQQAKQLTGGLSMTSLTTVPKQAPGLTRAGTATVQGQSAYVLKDSQGNRLDVSTSPAHLPLAVSTNSTPRQVISYSHWNSAPQPVPPPAGQVVNLNQLTR